MLISDVYTKARFHLNDIDGELFTDEILFEAVKIANDELSDELIVNGIPAQKNISVDIAVVALATSLTLPSNFIVPVKLWERAQNSDDQYSPMTESIWPPEMPQGTDLVSWNFRNQIVNLIGATTNREVRLDYIRALTALTDETGTNSVEIIGATNYLAYQTAGLAAEAIGGNTAIADRMYILADKRLEKILQIGVRNSQGVRSRRRPFRLPRVRRFF